MKFKIKNIYKFQKEMGVSFLKCHHCRFGGNPKTDFKTGKDYVYCFLYKTRIYKEERWLNYLLGYCQIFYV